VLVNIPVARRVPDVGTRLADEILAAEVALGATGRVLVRPSGTEPLIRVMVEAPTDQDARAAADSLATVVHERFG
jgi:phosphoglucosamine mutase